MTESEKVRWIAMGEYMKKSKLKLFVWTDFCPDYTSGLAFALAPDAETAMKMIKDKQGYEPTWGDLHIHELNDPIAYSVSGGG